MAGVRSWERDAAEPVHRYVTNGRQFEWEVTRRIVSDPSTPAFPAKCVESAPWPTRTTAPVRHGREVWHRQAPPAPVRVPWARLRAAGAGGEDVGVPQEAAQGAEPGGAGRALLPHQVRLFADLHQGAVCVVYPEGAWYRTSRRRTPSGSSRNTWWGDGWWKIFAVRGIRCSRRPTSCRGARRPVGRRSTARPGDTSRGTGSRSFGNTGSSRSAQVPGVVEGLAGGRIGA